MPTMPDCEIQSARLPNSVIITYTRFDERKFLCPPILKFIRVMWLCLLLRWNSHAELSKTFLDFCPKQPDCKLTCRHLKGQLVFCVGCGKS